MSLESTEDLTNNTALAALQPALDDGESDDFSDEEAGGYEGVRGGSFESESDDVQPRAATGKTGAESDDAADAAQSQAQPRGEKASAPAPSPSPQPAARIGRWSEDEVAQRFADLEGLRSGHQKVAGIVGNLQQRLMAAGQPRKVTKADLSKITEEFGDAYAEALAEDLNKIGFGGSQGADEATIERIVTERAQAQGADIERKFEKRLVTRSHRDADEFFINPDANGQPVVGKHAHAFRAWVTSLPKEDAELIATSWNADVMIDALDRFKQHQKDEAAKAVQGQQTGQEGQSNTATSRHNRLQRAVTPKGAGGSAAAAEEDPFEAGYKSARKSG